jgi:hypothetical protein
LRSWDGHRAASRAIRDVPANTLPECFTPPKCADMSHVWASHETDDPHWGQLLGGAA